MKADDEIQLFQASHPNPVVKSIDGRSKFNVAL